MANIRLIKNSIVKNAMFSLTAISSLLVVIIGVGLYIKSGPILEQHSLWNLLTDSHWKPMKGEFGFLPFAMGTLWVTLLALIIVLPASLLTAIFLTEYAKPVFKKYLFPVLDILAALPSVIYGVWGTLVIVPWVSEKVAPLFVDFSSGYTVLSAGIVLGIMILPLLVSLFIEVFSIVPSDLREASLSLGATKWQTTKFIILRKSFSGIFASVVLAVSRALGETMAILMVCGCSPLIPRSILDACYPIPALIANNYGEMLSLPLYESALMFSALMLFVIVLVFNLVSRIILYRMNKVLA